MPESGAARIRELEIRLFDFAREVEGRIESRQLLLDRLMAAADREIARLQGLLGRGRAESGIPGEETRGRRPDLVQYGPPDSPPAGRDLRAAASPRQPSTGILAQAMLAMADEGRSIDEIALATGQPQAKVQALIDALRSLDRREAA